MGFGQILNEIARRETPLPSASSRLPRTSRCRPISALGSINVDSSPARAWPIPPFSLHRVVRAQGAAPRTRHRRIQSHDYARGAGAVAFREWRALLPIATVYDPFIYRGRSAELCPLPGCALYAGRNAIARRCGHISSRRRCARLLRPGTGFRSVAASGSSIPSRFLRKQSSPHGIRRTKQQREAIGRAVLEGAGQLLDEALLQKPGPLLSGSGFRAPVAVVKMFGIIGFDCRADPIEIMVSQTACWR